MINTAGTMQSLAFGCRGRSSRAALFVVPGERDTRRYFETIEPCPSVVDLVDQPAAMEHVTPSTNGTRHI